MDCTQAIEVHLVLHFWALPNLAGEANVHDKKYKAPPPSNTWDSWENFPIYININESTSLPWFPHGFPHESPAAMDSCLPLQDTVKPPPHIYTVASRAFEGLANARLSQVQLGISMDEYIIYTVVTHIYIYDYICIYNVYIYIYVCNVYIYIHII